MTRILKLIVLLAIYTQPLDSAGQDLNRMNRGELRELAAQLQKENEELKNQILSLKEAEILLQQNIQKLADESSIQVQFIANLNSQIATHQSQINEYESRILDSNKDIGRLGVVIDSLTNQVIILTELAQSLRDSLGNNKPDMSSIVSSPTCAGVSDIDGNCYKTVQIGTQLWMAENLRTSKYQNGDPIPNVSDKTEWSSNWPTGSWTHYNNDSQNELVYGKLYNFNAMDDTRRICPVGWHVPGDWEWSTMQDFLSTDVGYKLKAGSFDGSNSSGFNAVAGGYRDYFGEFIDLGTEGHMWSTSQPSAQSAWVRVLRYDSRDMNTDTPDLFTGMSIRCLRDY